VLQYTLFGNMICGYVVPLNSILAITLQQVHIATCFAERNVSKLNFKEGDKSRFFIFIFLSIETTSFTCIIH